MERTSLKGRGIFRDDFSMEQSFMGIIWETANLEKDERAIELAKVALGWDSMTTAQQRDSAQDLVIRAQQIKGALWHTR